MTAPLLSTSECRSLLDAFAGDESSRSMEIIDVEIKPLEGPRAGFMSDHLRLKLSVRDASGEEKQLRFFAKCIPRVPIHKEYVESTKFYVKETAFYDTLLKDLRKAQRDGGHNRWIPECYFVRDDLIVLEDISLQGFKVFGHRDLMDLETAESVFAELARFHAASVVCEESMQENPRPLNEVYPSVLEERSGSTLRSDGERGWFQASVRSTHRLVQHLPKYKDDPQIVRTIREKLPEACAVMNTIVLSSSKYRNVVSHGDIWASNVLVKRSAEGKPIGVRFVDLQLVRYSPPACDVLILLYIMTDRKFREQYKNHIFKHYYDEFSKELTLIGLNAEKLLPFSEFQETCEFYKPLGLIVTAMCLQMVLLKPEFVDPFFKEPESFVNFMLMDRSEAIVSALESDEEYRLRVTDAVEEFIDTCILQTST